MTLRRGAVVAAVLASMLSTVAVAQPAAVEVEDLPPLPAPAEPDGEGDVAVVAAAAVEEDVVVGAGKREQSLGNVASAVTVISGDRLRRFGYRTVAEAVRGVAGVFVVDDHMTDRIGIRGLQVSGDFNTRILVLVDGSTVNEPWGQLAGVGWDAPVSIDDVARIEVIRGPVSSLYGTNAFFGIVNIVTRGADQSARAWGRLSGNWFLGGAVAAGFAAGDVDRQLRGSVAALYRGGESLSVPQIGDELGAGVDRAQAVNAGLVGAWGGGFAHLRFYRRERTLPFAPYGATPGDDRTQNVDTQLMLEGGYRHAVSERLTVTGRLYGNVYRFTDYLVYEPDAPNFEDVGDSRWAGVELRSRWDALDRGRLGVTAGGEATWVATRSHSFDEAGDVDVTVPVDFDVQGLYAEVDGQPLPWLAFTGGVRLDRNSILEDRASPRAALFLARQDRVGLKLLYAEGFRNPSPYEGFFADGDAFEANPDIRAETIRSYEVVLWGRPIRGLATRLSGFRWEADRIVEQTEGPGGLLQFQNLGALTSTGVELEASYRDARGWMGFAGATVAHVEGEDGDDVVGAPALTAQLGVSSPLIARSVHLSTELMMIGARPVRGVDGVDPDRDAAAFVGWNLVAYLPDLRGFDVTVGVRNLLGRREDNPAQEDFDRTDALGETVIVPVLPGEGRELHARVGHRF